MKGFGEPSSIEKYERMHRRGLTRQEAKEAAAGRHLVGLLDIRHVFVDPPTAMFVWLVETLGTRWSFGVGFGGYFIFDSEADALAFAQRWRKSPSDDQ